MAGPLADHMKRLIGRPSVPDAGGEAAARLVIDGDVDGALVAAEQLRSSRDPLIRSEGYAVRAWVHLVRGERDKAEAAASLSRHARTPEPLLTVALVVASGGPSEGAAAAFADSKAVLSLVGATQVVVDHGKLRDVRDEIARLAPKREGAALESLKVGLVALSRWTDVDEVTDRLAELHRTPRLDALYASSLGKLGMTELAVRYLRLAADRGFADLDLVTSDPNLAEVRAQPTFSSIRDRMVANARPPVGDTES